MRKARDDHLGEEDLAVVETGIHHDERPEVRVRCSVIRLLHLGHKSEQVAAMQAVSKPTIYGWIDRWNSGKVEGLANKPKSGRPLKADDEVVKSAEKTLIAQNDQTTDLRYHVSKNL
jgi:transposase